MPARPKVVAFDIIETVFSLEPLRPPVVAIGLPPSAVELLYATALRDLVCLTAAGDFQPFRACLEGALGEVLERLERTARVDQKEAVLEAMRVLPPQPYAREAFEILRDAGMEVVALSNGAKKSTQALLERASLDQLVDRVHSIEEVRVSKPKLEVYRFAAAQAGVRPEELAMVACHPWDLHGAKLAGLVTGFVARGRSVSPAMKQPDVRGETLADVSRALTLL